MGLRACGMLFGFVAGGHHLPNLFVALESLKVISFHRRLPVNLLPIETSLDTDTYQNILGGYKTKLEDFRNSLIGIS